MNFVSFYFSLDDGSILPLKYELLDSDLTEKWKKEVEKQQLVNGAELKTFFHRTEVEDWPNYSVVCCIDPPVQGTSLDESDYEIHTTDYVWGGLYLDPNTGSIDYYDAMWSDNIEAIKNGEVKIQDHVSSNVWLNFGPTCYMPKINNCLFNKWRKELDPEVNKLIPNHNRLGGRYVLGRLVIDNNFLNMHENVDEWRYSLELQKNWNKEVFSRVEEFIGIDFETI